MQASFTITERLLFMEACRSEASVDGFFTAEHH
jgi:hypothetical protein